MAAPHLPSTSSPPARQSVNPSVTPRLLDERAAPSGPESPRRPPAKLGSGRGRRDRKHNRPTKGHLPDGAKLLMVNVRLPAALVDALREHALANGTSVSGEMRGLVIKEFPDVIMGARS